MRISYVFVTSLLFSALQARAMENREEREPFMNLLAEHKWAEAQKMLESDPKFVPYVNSLRTDLKPLYQASHEMHSAILHALQNRGFCSLALLLHVYDAHEKIVHDYLSFEGVKAYLKKEFSPVFLDTLLMRGKI